MGLLGCAMHHGGAPGGVALMLDFAADRLEIANLVTGMTGHGTYVGAIKHDNGPARVRRRALVRLGRGSRDLRCRLPVDRLELQGDGMGAGAQAFLIRRRGQPQGAQETRRVPKRGARA